MIRRIHGALNALLLFSALVTTTLYLTPLGLEGSIWVAVTVAICGAFLLLNIFRLRFSRMLIYGLPVMFVVAGTLMKYSALSASSIRSAITTSVVFAMLWLRPVPLSHKLVKFLVVLYLVVGTVLSMRNLYSDPTFDGNANFNANPAAAAYYFWLCGMLSLLFLRSGIRWVFVGLFALLMVSTQVRAGAAVFAVSLGAYYLLRNPQRYSRTIQTLRAIRTGARRQLSPRRFALRTVQLVPVALLAWYGALLVAPEASAGLMRRIQVAFGPAGFVNNRAKIWDEALALSTASRQTFLFGNGPATMAEIIGAGTHNSYLEALGSYGLFFVVASVIAVVSRIRMLKRQGHWQILVVGPALLLYGITDTFLFYGVAMLWVFLVFFSIYLESVDSARRRVVRVVREPVAAPAPPAVPVLDRPQPAVAPGAAALAGGLNPS